MWLCCVKGTGKIEEHQAHSTSCFFLNVNMYFLNCIKLHHQYSCFSCKQTVMDQCNLLLFQFTEDHSFTYVYHSRGKCYRAKIIHGRYDRSLQYRHNACSFPSSWNSICGETCIKYNAKNVSKLFSTCLKYSWCNVILASGFVGIIVSLRGIFPLFHPLLRQAGVSGFGSKIFMFCEMGKQFNHYFL